MPYGFHSKKLKRHQSLGMGRMDKIALSGWRVKEYGRRIKATRAREDEERKRRALPQSARQVKRFKYRSARRAAGLYRVVGAHGDRSKRYRARGY